jgi:hypothetical protein
MHALFFEWRFQWQAMAISKIACFLIYAYIFAIAHLNKVGLEQNFFSLNKLLILLKLSLTRQVSSTPGIT